MRQRSTWTDQTSAATTDRTAATGRRADDIYDMNVDHPQPAITDYDTGDPSAWAEDVNSGKSVESEYQGGAVKRDEIGMPEMRDDTWNHRGTKPWGTGGGSYDNQRLAAAERKAMACERIARAILRTGNEKLLEPTMMELMALPPKSIVAMLGRMDKLSPAALSKEARYRRALACTKLSALLLTEEAKEEALERLATTFAHLDDGTLKTILNLVATERVAMEEGEGEGAEEHTSAEKKDDDGPPEEVKEEAEAKEEEKEEKEEEKEEDRPDVLGEGDLDKLRDMMEEVEAGAEEGVEEGGLEVPEGAPDAGPEITFGEEEEGGGMDMPPEMPVMAADDGLTGLFDNEESLAQREIAQAEQGPGYAPVAARTASTKGAKKLGAVRAASGSGDDLNALWDRPDEA